MKRPGDGGDDDSAGADGERAQLIIIVALALAIVLVALALVVNSAIYAENLATRETADSDAFSAAFAEGTAEAESAMAQVNPEYHSRSAVDDNFTDILDHWTAASRDRHASQGAYYEFETTAQTDGTLVRHENASRNFTDADGDRSWNLADDVTGVSEYRTTVDNESLHEPAMLDSIDDIRSDAYQVEYDDDAGTAWTVYAYRNATGDVVVFAETNDALDGSVFGLGNVTDELNSELGGFDDGCIADNGTVTIDFVNGTVEGQACGVLAFPGFGDDLNATVRNGHNATGTYELLVAGVVDTGEYNEEPTADSPSVTPAVYDARVAMEFERTDGSVERDDVRVTAGAEVWRLT